MLDKFHINLQLFADGGTLVNTSQNYVNAYTGEATPFDETHSLNTTMKVFYDKNLLKNERPNLYFEQLGRKESMPANNGRTKEWRKFNKLPNADVLVEGVIPAGKKMAQTAMTVSLQQLGMYVAVSDILDLHAVDNVIMAASEELGASAALTKDTLIRDELMTGTNVMFCDTVNEDGTTVSPTDYDEMSLTNNRLTPDMVNQAAVFLKKSDAPTINGKYVAVVHPSVVYDIRRTDEWVEAHKYANVTPIYNGEIGELHGVRFIETSNAKITQKTLNDGTGMVYSTMIFGKDAFGVLDPEGGNLEMIVKDKGSIGGPLEQFSTIGYKFEDATKILYPNRMVRLESCSKYSTKDEEN